MSEHILLIDDDALLRRSLAFALERAGYTVTLAASAEDGLAQLAGAHPDFTPPDLVLLDIGLPGMDGLDALRHLRRQADLPVIFVTARRRELEQVLGLELGADDYVTKPFDVEVLLARIKAVLRRYRTAEQPVHTAATATLGDLEIDASAHTVQVGARALDLTPREFELLRTLAHQPGHVFSAEELLDRVWGDGFYGEPQVLYVHIRRLREKIEDDPSQPRRILTVRGIGYKLAVQEV